jgi:hypothetical protein
LDITFPFLTATPTEPGAVRSEEGIVALSCLLDRKTVTLAALPITTMEFGRKLLPYTCRSIPGDPAVTLFGDNAVINGATDGGLLIKKAAVLDSNVPPPWAGSTTLTDTIPAQDRDAASIDVANLVAFTKVVIRLTPFQAIASPEEKPVPFTVSTNPGEPASAADGLREVMENAVAGVGRVAWRIMRTRAVKMVKALVLPPLLQ